jgi:hypothetical protein
MTLSAAPERTPAQDSLSRSLAVPAIVACFLVSFLAIAILTDRHVNPYDEGHILTGAMQVAAGHIPRGPVADERNARFPSGKLLDGTAE